MSFGRSEEDTEAALAREIKRCGSLYDLHSLMETKWDGLGMVATTAAVVRLAKLYAVHVASKGKRRPDGPMARRSDSAKLGRSRAKGRDSAGERATASEELAARAPLRRELLARIHGMVWDLDAVGVSNCLWALSRIQLQGDAVPRALVKELSSAAGSQAEAMNAQSISNALYALAVLLDDQQRAVLLDDQQRVHKDDGGSEKAMSELPSAVGAALSTIEQCSVTGTATSSVNQSYEGPLRRRQVGPPTPHHTLQPLVDACGARMPSFGPQAVCNSAWALARLGCRPTTTWTESFLVRSSQVSVLVCRVHWGNSGLIFLGISLLISCHGMMLTLR